MSFLYPYQMDAVNKMKNGCILNGGVGSGKSRTGLYYYYKEQGGCLQDDNVPMKKPRDLYIITTAMKRDSKEWEGELIPFGLYNVVKPKVVIDSWNNIKKYRSATEAFFIFDEDRVCGSGAWVKAFWDISRKNQWIILSATPGDDWLDYFPVFKANGFFKTKAEFNANHVIYSRYSKYPKIEGYYDTWTLERMKASILVDMDFIRGTTRHNVDMWCEYDKTLYKSTIKNRWDPYKNEPIEQASSLCYILRRIVNEDPSRQFALMTLLAEHPKSIIFYSFDYELEILRKTMIGMNIPFAEWNGHNHQHLPTGDEWAYLVQYTAGAEGWNAITTDTIIFYDQQYSYKALEQASGRIDRVNTPFKDLYYYHLKSRSSIDLAISKALHDKKLFNEKKWSGFNK